jgi:mono/diheme cytochrome c family protein
MDSLFLSQELKSSYMYRIIFLYFSLVMLLSCCGNSNSSGSKTEKLSSSKASSVQEIPPAVMERGEEVYRKYCLACHQTDGSGNPGMYPPLVDTKTVKGDKDKLINIIMNGIEGEIEVKGEIYNQVMVPHSFLSDEQIADVLTYIRNSFGNNASPVSVEEVAELRTEE